MNQTKGDELPAWFHRPKSNARWQGCLFTSRPDDALVPLQISRDEVRLWVDKGWLSFDLESAFQFDDFGDPRVAELTMVRDVVRSGLSDSQIGYLIGLLLKPCAVDPERIAFNFRHGWVEAMPAVPQPDPDPGETIDNHLDSWISGCGKDRLLEIRNQVGELLAKPDDTPAEPNP